MPERFNRTLRRSSSLLGEYSGETMHKSMRFTLHTCKWSFAGVASRLNASPYAGAEVNVRHEQRRGISYRAL